MVLVVARTNSDSAEIAEQWMVLCGLMGFFAKFSPSRYGSAGKMGKNNIDQSVHPFLGCSWDPTHQLRHFGLKLGYPKSRP